MNKCHQNINWQNDTTPAINETNLNYMDGCIDTIDDRVVALANDPPANALKAEGWAIGEQSGVPVTSDSPYYENNSKYYSQESANEVLKSEGFANGTQGGVPVSSGSPYYENNAKYWKEQAQAIASASLSGLSDVSITNPQDGEVLTYDADNSEWKNSSDLKDSIGYLYNMTGGKNLLPNTGTTEVKNAVTFTKNDSDGTFTLNSSGASGDTYKNIFNSSDIALYAGNDYIMTGFETPTANYKLQLNFYIAGEWVSWYADEGEVFTMPSGVAQVSINIFVKSGASFSNLKCYPMIRDASISDDTYVPYAKTNRELTQEQVKNTDLTSIIATGATNTTGAQIPNGAYFYLNGVFCRAIADIAANATFTKNTNYVETSVGDDFSKESVSFTAASGITINSGEYNLVRMGSFLSISLAFTVASASYATKVLTLDGVTVPNGSFFYAMTVGGSFIRGYFSDDNQMWVVNPSATTYIMNVVVALNKY